MAEMAVTVLTPRQAIYSGKAKSIILPGEKGVFELLPFHKSILSRLVSGEVYVDDERIGIVRGIVKMHHNEVTIIVEQV